jgi:hypothetical protein
MEFTFGIITRGDNDEQVMKIIRSIQALDIPTFEIIVIGSTQRTYMLPLSRVRFVPFDESVKPNWITRKKNMVCQLARYENVVLLHDYVIFHADWYRGFLRFGNSFDVCVNRILNQDGTRFRDYTLFPLYMRSIDPGFSTQCLLPYDFKPTKETAKLSYISGAYYVVKKHIALQYPLDEAKSWGEGEDVEFSYRTAGKGIVFQVNPHSVVSFLKHKGTLPWQNEIKDPRLLARLNSLTAEDLEKWKTDPECFHLFPLLYI